MSQTSVALSKRMEQWDLSAEDSSNTAPYISVASVEAPRGSVQRSPMWHFVANGQRVYCRRPVEVEIREDEEGSVIAACERLHVFASGATYDEAVESLSEQVVHFCNEYLSLSADDVIGQAVEIRELYHRYFEVER